MKELSKKIETLAREIAEPLEPNEIQELRVALHREYRRKRTPLDLKAILNFSPGDKVCWAGKIDGTVARVLRTNVIVDFGGTKYSVPASQLKKVE